MFIDGKCRSLKVVIDARERTRNINQKKTSEVLQAYLDLHTQTKAVGEGISSISKKNIMNQLDKHDFSCD